MTETITTEEVLNVLNRLLTSYEEDAKESYQKIQEFEYSKDKKMNELLRIQYQDQIECATKENLAYYRGVRDALRTFKDNLMEVE